MCHTCVHLRLACKHASCSVQQSMCVCLCVFDFMFALPLTRERFTPLSIMDLFFSSNNYASTVITNGIIPQHGAPTTIFY